MSVDKKNVFLKKFVSRHRDFNWRNKILLQMVLLMGEFFLTLLRSANTFRINIEENL